MREKDELIEQIEALQDIKPLPRNAHEINLKKMFKKIPLLTAFFRSVNIAKEPLMSLISLSEGGGPSALGASPLLALVLAALDFAYLPFLYISFKLQKITPPITLTHLGRWVASGIIFGLLLAAFFIPGIAHILGLAVASTALLVTIGTFVKTLKYHQELKKSLKANLKEQQQIIEDLHLLRNKVNEAKKQGKEDYEVLKKFFQDQLENRRIILQKLKTEEAEIKEELETKNRFVFFYKVLMVALACLAVVGLAIVPVFPFVGLSLFAVGSAIASVCLLCQIGAFLRILWQARRNKSNSPIETPAAPIHNSTNVINDLLMKNMPNLKEHLARAHEIHQTKDEQKARTFFQELSKAASKSRLGTQELHHFFKSREDLHQLLKWYQSTPHHAEEIGFYAPLKTVLRTPLEETPKPSEDIHK